MMLYSEGDHSSGICEDCHKVVRTIFRHRPLKLDSPPVTIPDVLVAVCLECGEVVGIPHQSTPKIQDAREQAAIQPE